MINTIKVDQITAGKISMDNFLEEISPYAKAQWEQLGRRLKAEDEFDKAHPVLKHIKYWPIIGRWYRRRSLVYVLKEEEK